MRILIAVLFAFSVHAQPAAWTWSDPTFVGSLVPQPSGGAPSCNNQVATIGTASTRTDSYWVGFMFTVGATNITICTLQRLCMGAPSIVSHTVEILSSSGIVATAAVNMTGTSVGAYASTSISTVTLTAGQTYAVVVDETVGDNWYNNNGTITLSGACSGSFFSVYSASPPATTGALSLAGSGQTFSGPNFLYQ